MAAPIKYAFVARGADVLAELPGVPPADAARHKAVGQSCLDRCPPGGDAARYTFTVDGATYNYVIDGRFAFLAVSDEGTGRTLPFAFLESARSEFAAKHADRAATAPAGGLDRAFGPRLRAAADHVAAHPDEASRVAGLQAQVDAVKAVMVDNIERVLARGERVEALVDKTDDLRAQAGRFQRTGAALRRKMWWNNVKVWVLVALLLGALALVIFLSVCFSGGNCFKGKN